MRVFLGLKIEFFFSFLFSKKIEFLFAWLLQGTEVREREEVLALGVTRVFITKGRYI